MKSKNASLFFTFLLNVSVLLSQNGTTLQKFIFDNSTDQLILDEHMRNLKLDEPFLLDFWANASQLNTTLGKHTLFFHVKASGNAECDVNGNYGGFAKGLWVGYVFENNVWYFRVYKPTWNRYERGYFYFGSDQMIVNLRIDTFDEASEIVGKWAHWAVSYNQSNGWLYIYFNGVKKYWVQLSTSEWFLWAGDCVHNGFWSDMFLGPHEQTGVTRGYNVFDHVDNGRILFGSVGPKDNTNSHYSQNRYPFTGSIAQIRLRQINYSADTYNDYNKVTDYTRPEYFYYLKHSNDLVGHAVYNTNVAVQAASDLPVHPREVTNLTATGGCNSVTLSWNLEDATSSGVWRTPDDAFFYAYGTNTFTDNPPRPDVEYTYTVKGLWNVWVGDWTNYFSKDGVTVKAKRGDPGPPTTFTATPDCDGTVRLEWGRKAEATGYQIEIGDLNNFTNGTQTVVPLGNVFTYTHAPNTPDKTYIYKIISQNNLNCDRNASNFREATATTKTTCTTAPTNVQAAVNGDAINVTWAYTHATGSAPNRFSIMRSTGGTSDFVSVGTATGISNRSYTDLNVASCVNYYYKVQALAPCGGTTASISTASTVAKKIAPFIHVFDASSGAMFSGSKGYFGDKVELEWKVNPNKIGDVSQFQIFRKESETGPATLIKTLVGSSYSTWNDVSVEANKVYYYELKAVADCEGTPIYSESITTTGFRIKAGLVSGKITFEGGNTVENVEVRSSRGVAPTSCLDFSKAAGTAYKSYTSTLRPDTAVSVEAWVYSSQWNSINGAQMILEMDWTANLYLTGNRVVCGIITSDEKECKIDYGYNFSETTGWHHFAYTFGNGTLSLYIDGKKKSSVNANTTIKTLKFLPNTLVTIGSQTETMTLPFKGKLDEIRIWNRCKTEEEIGFDYIRNLSADEAGLMAYWRMDENTGNYLYDCSKQNGVYNKNHLLFSGSPEWSDATPSYEQLHPSGLTDKYGNYKVTNIAYTGTGEIFSITPIKGIHRFDPTDRTLFIGDNSPVQNNIDFTDKSSFVFHGRVLYKNTNFPVKTASVYIDDAIVVGDGKLPVTTDEYGEFTINVPIGNHYISVKKDGHLFESNGQWPLPTTNEPFKKFNFQDDIAQSMTFNDITRVKVAGRFVGGNVEGNKKLGFNKSINNIGVGTIVLTIPNLDIDTTETGNSDKISITTDVNSGEYFVQLLPEKYTILSVNNNKYQLKTESLGILDLTSIPALTTVTDTIYRLDNQGNPTNIVDKIQTNSYHNSRNFIYYAQPTLRVYSKDHYPLKGEDTIRVSNPITSRDTTIRLTDSISPFRYPVFRMGARYPIKIFVYEEYENTNKLDQVPVADAEVTINNSIEVNASVKVFKTDQNGFVADYTVFQTGTPNMSTDASNLSSYTKTISMTAKTSADQTAWPETGVFRGYILGSVDAGGSNFVSYGPQMPAIVVHDPPGSNSYAYLKKGSEYTVKQSSSFIMESNTRYDNIISMGYNFQMGGGLAGPVFKNRFINDVKLGLAVQSYSSNDGGYMEKWTFNEDFRTSDASNAVGSMADIFIGQSQNYYFSETKNLQILPVDFCTSNGFESLSRTELTTANEFFTLGIRDGFAASPQTENTLFVYSQDHIINKLIPELMKLRNNLLANNSKYVSNVPANNVNYGLPNDHPVWRALGDSSAHPSYVFTPAVAGEMDSLEFIHQQISIWMQTIALNEAAKVEASFDANVSFDGLSGAYQREANLVSTIYDGKKYQKSFKLFGGSNSGFNANGLGVYMSSESSMNFSQQIANNEEDTKTMTWGFVIDDSDQGDYYSVAIANNEYLKPLDIDNFTSTNRKMDDKIYLLNLLTGGVGAVGGTGAIIKKMIELKAKDQVAPGYVGSVIGMALTSTLQAISMGIFGSFISDIDDTGHPAIFSAVTHSPIFKILGGQSRCPYEGPEYSIFYSNSSGSEPAIIHIGTQQQEMPEISIEPGERVNVPENAKAEFTLKLTNASPTNRDLTYYLKVDEAANPDGAILTIDGINPNFRQFFIPAGQTLTKTLTVQKGSNSIMDYNNLGLIIHSACQFDPEDNIPDIADTAIFSVHFLPTCTNVDLAPQENWVVNTSDKDTMTVVLSGYDLNSTNFEKMVFQYRSPGGPTITPITFVKNAADTASVQGAKELINNRSGITWMFPMENLNDGTYEIRAKTICKGGYEYVTPWYSGVLDGLRPKQFGTPQPSGGILWTGGELSIQFNEALNAGYLNAHKELISLKGVLNNTDLTNFKFIQHDASIHFDGIQQHMMVPDGINLKYTSFTIEFWAKRERTGKECLISQDNPLSGGLWLGFDENDRFMMKLNGQTITTDKKYDNILNQWSHFACVFNNGSDGDSKGITLVVAADAGTEEIYRKVDYGYFANGPFYAGYCHDDGTAFKGNMHDLRVWSQYRMLADISSGMYQLHSGFEKGLCSLWPMDDATGGYARDIAFSRNGIVNATWQVSRDGKAIALNGGYLSFSTEGMAFDKESDFTLEFWFKGAAGSDTVYLFSGDLLNSSGWGVGSTSEGKLFIRNGLKTFKASNTNYLDNNWHHFALSMNRRNSINIYMDNLLTQTVSASGFDGFGTDKCILGARYMAAFDGDRMDQRFAGAVDEIRFWNMSKPKSQIVRYMQHSLTGEEIGLKAYYPFEDVTITDPSLTAQTLRNMTYDTIGVAGLSEPLGLCGYTDETPSIKLHLPLTDISFDYVVNGDKIIITPNIEERKIEHTNLEISVMGVKDVNNNTMASAVTWSAFVNRNMLFWGDQKVSHTITIGEPLTFTELIANLGGETKEWEIYNLPLWLSADITSGTIDALRSQEINFTLNPAINVGEYAHDIYISSTEGSPERLVIQLIVKGVEPDWAVDSDTFEQSMSLVGKIMIGEHFCNNVHDKVWAFVGNECRGSGYQEYIKALDDYVLFLDIFGNTNGETLTFKIWDACDAKIYTDALPILTFVKNDVLGTINDPVIIYSNGEISRELNVVNGWKWLSFNLETSKLKNTNTLMQGVQAKEGNAIKGLGVYDLFNEGLGWMGGLTNGGGLQKDKMYMFHLSQEDIIHYSGLPVAVSSVPITIYNGWNWIGYPPQVKIPTNEALGYLIPEQDDVIKSQYDFALFDKAIGWYGCLNYLEPGVGYKYKAHISASEGSKTFIYPSESMLRSTSLEMEKVSINDFKPEAWMNTMSLVAQLKAEDGSDFTDKTLLAYNKGKLVGAARAADIKVEADPLFFMTLYGEEEEDSLSFKIATVENQSILATTNVNELILFSPDALLGTINQPVKLTLQKSSMVTDPIICYPNPFRETVTILLNTTEKASSIEICDLLGRTIEALTPLNNKVVWRGTSQGTQASASLYLVKIRTENGAIYYKKMIKQ